MVAVVILIEGYDPIAGAPVSIYAGSHDDPAVCHLNGATLWPTIAKLPVLRYDLFDGAFAGQISAPSSSLTLRTAPWPDFGRYQLADARLRLWTGEVGSAWATWTLRFDGRITGQPSMQDGAADIAFAVDDRWLDKALLPLYAGTTGAEGPAALKGQAKPLALGAPRYVPGTLIDSVNSVFQVSAFSINGVEAALERLARFGAAQADYPTYAALVAAALPAGTWATCRAAGLVRFGAPPTGQVSFLLQGDNAGQDGWARLPGRIIRRLATIAGGAGKLNDASLNALDAARPYTVSVYLDQQTTAREIIQSIAASLNCVAGVSWTGQLFIAPVAIGAADVVLSADGTTLPPVQSVQQIEIAAPFQKLAMGAERAWSVHSLDEIAFTATLVDVGTYSAATTYREGNVVTLPSGARYLFVASAPTAGVAPPNAAYWSQLSAASIIDYANVTGATRPEDNATVGATLGANGGTGNIRRANGGLNWLEADLNTIVGTAAAITGQGAFATANSAAYGSPLLTGFGTLASLASIAFGSTFLRASNGATATDALYQTGLGTAAGIVGQGLFATLSSAAYGSSLLTGFGALAPLASISFGSSFLRTGAGGTATDAAYQTILGTASAITGQGALATKNAATWDSDVVGIGKPASYASVDTIITLGIDAGNAVQVANTIYKSGGTTGYNINGDGGSTQAFGRASTGSIRLQARHYTNGQQASMSLHTGTNYRVNDQVVSLRTNADKTANAWTGNQDLGQIAGYVDGNTVYGLEYDGSRFKWLINGQVAYSLIANPGLVLTPGFHMASIGSGWREINVTAGARAGRTGDFLYDQVGTMLTDGLIKTTLGTAAGIAGQGAFATLSSAAYGSSLLTGFGALAPLASIAFGSSYLRTGSGASATDAAYQTGLGTAAGITGQGQWATYSATSPSKLEGIAPRATAGDNLVQNPIFATDAAGWTLAANTARVARSAGDPAAFLRGTGNSTGFGTAAPFPLSIGQQTLFFSYWRRSSVAGAQLAVDISFYDAAGAGIPGTRVNNFGAAYRDVTATSVSSLAAGVWGMVSGSITVPFGAAQVGVGMTMVPGTGETMDVTAIVLSTSEQSVARNAKVAGSDLGAGAGDNLIVNGEFLDGLNNFEYTGPLTIQAGTAAGEPARFVRLAGAVGDAGLSSKAAYPTNFPIEADKPIFMSARIRGSRAGMQVAFFVTCYSSTIGYLGGAFLTSNVYTAAANAWQTVEVSGRTPANTAYAQVQVVLVNPGANSTIDFASWRLANTQRGATLGADVAANVTDAGTLLSRTALITTLGVASGFTGQGALATQSSLGLGSSYLTGFGAMAGLDRARLMVGAGGIADETNSYWVTNALAITSLGTASGIAGQGAFATQSRLDLTNASYFNPTGRFAPLDNGDANYFNASRIQYGTASTGYASLQSMQPQEAGSNVTETRTAAAIVGQGGLATKNQATYGTDLTGFPYPLNPSNMVFADSALRLRADAMLYGNGAYVQNLQPQESGSNKTETRTAAAIVGQGGLATKNQADYAVDIVGRPLNVGNLIITSSFALGSRGKWGTAGATTVVPAGQGQSFAMAGRSTLRDTVESYSDIPVAEGETLYFDLWLNADESQSTVGAGLFARDKAGNTSFPIPITLPAGSGWTRRTGTYVVAPGIVTVTPFVWCDYNGSGGQAVKWAEFQLTRAQLGATVGGQFGVNVKNNGGGLVRDADVITTQGTAAAVTGQSPWATYGGLNPTNVANQVQFLQPDGAMKAQYIYQPNVGQLSNFFPAEGGSNRTEGHTAAGIAGQGPFATRAGGVSLDDGSLFNMASTPRLAPLDNGDTRYLNADRILYGNTATGYANLQQLKPMEGGANVTEARVASAVTGQGKLATAGQIGSWNVSQYFAFSAFSLNYSITRSDGTSIVTESLAITQYGVAAGFAGQGSLATKNQASAADLAPSAVQIVTFEKLKQTIVCPVGN